MRNDFYPEGTARALLESENVTPNTKQVLNDRLASEEILLQRYLNSEHFETLKAVCARLIPQPQRERPIDLPGLLDGQLASDSGNGWRYASMPTDPEAMVSGLHGIRETAVLLYNKEFYLLEASQQDGILRSLQHGTARTATWERLPASLFFEELLTRLVEIYYSHPLAKEEIGDISFADSNGWSVPGLNQRESYEPEPIKSLQE